MMNKLMVHVALLAMTGCGTVGMDVLPMQPANGAAFATVAAPRLVSVPAQPAADAARLYASIWLEGGREPFRPGDRVRIRFQSSTDAHVAVIHLDTEGNLELLFPEAPWASDLVRGGRTNALPASGWDARWTVAEPPGIGYFYIVASHEPLDYRALRHSSGTRWDWRRVGGNVRGDPFYALDQVADLLTGGWNGSSFATDLQSYYVGHRPRYPAYACSDRYTYNQWDADTYYGSCDRVLILLRDRPDYYDTRRDRRDRRGYISATEADASHGYKAPARQTVPSGLRRPGSPPAATRNEEPRAPPTRRPIVPSRTRPEPAAERPRLERRPAERPRAEPPARTRPADPPESKREPAPRPESSSRPSEKPAPDRPPGG